MNDNLQAIKDDYCGSELSVRAVATKHNLSPGRICQLAKEQGWPARSLNASGGEPTEDGGEVATEVASEEVNKEVTKEVATQAVDGEAVSGAVSGSVSIDDSPSDDALDRDARISLTRAQAEGMSISKRELVIRVSVAEADRHPDFHDAIAAIKLRRRAANLRHRESVERSMATVRAGQTAAGRIDALAQERLEQQAAYPALAVAFATGERDAAALVQHEQELHSIDLQMAALKAALPQLDLQVRRLISGNERLAHDAGDADAELAKIRAEAACAIVDAKW